MTRDSGVLKWLLLASVILGVLATVTDPTLYGMNPVSGAVVMNWIKLISLIVTAVSGWLQTSPLKGENDGDTVKRNNITGWVLPLLLAGSLASGCALGGAVVTPPPPGGPTAEQVQAVRNEAAKLATATKEAATLAVNARRLVQSGFEAGLVSRDALQKVNDASIVVSQKGIAFVNFAETVTTDPSLRVTATELLKIFDDYIVALSGAGQSGAAIRTALAVLRAYLGVQ